MVLNFGGLFKKSIFRRSPEDWEIDHWEGDRQVSGVAGGVGATNWAATGTAVDNASVGTLTWADPTNIQTDDTNRATTNTSPTAITHYLKCTNFSFSLPQGATVTGVEFRFKRDSDEGTAFPEVRDENVKLVVEDAVVGTNQSTYDWKQVADSQDSVGGSAELWGASVTKAQAEASDFGVVISANVYTGGAGVNYLRIAFVEGRVHYIT